MKTLQSLFKNPLVIASLGCLVAFAAACGDDDDSSNPAPAGGSKNMGGSSSAAGKTSNGGGTKATAGETSMAGAGNDTATGGGGVGPGPDTTPGGAAGMGGAPVDCADETDMGCYRCAPKTLTQFLNACPTTGCEPFDNSKLTSIKAGKLPDLP